MKENEITTHVEHHTKLHFVRFKQQRMTEFHKTTISKCELFCDSSVLSCVSISILNPQPYCLGVPGGKVPERLRKELLNMLEKEASLRARDVSGEASPLALFTDTLKSRDGLRCLNVPSR